MKDLATERLAEALAVGSRENLAAWATTGRSGVLLVREELAGQRTIEPSQPTDPRDILDNLGAAVTAIARTEPDAFLQLFDGADWASNSFVLDALGAIDDERATQRLVHAAVSGDHSVRAHAAIGLGGRTSVAGSIALGRLLGDRAYLVRYHALASLARAGVPAALGDLERFDPPSELERTMRDGALAAIARRASDDPPTD